MANDYYEVERPPQPRERARAEVVAAELQSIERGFEGLPSKNELAGQVQVVAEETSESAANVYVLDSEYPVTALTTGTTARFFATNTNTAASTVNLDGTGVKSLVNIDGTALTGGEIVAGWPVEIIYNGTHFRLMNSATRITAGIVLASSLSPQNYQRNAAIADLTLPAASGGASPYTYAASDLPTGLSFNATNRVVSGTPTTVGSSTVTYTVTDANSNAFTFQFQIRIVEQVLVLAAPRDRTLTEGVQITFTFAPATGGTPTYTYSARNLPPGMTFDAETREFSGMPSDPGSYSVTVSVSDSGSPVQTASQSFTMNVRSALPLSLATVPDRTFTPSVQITPFSLPVATGGVPPYTNIVTGLGEGLSFSARTRVVSGTPAQTGARAVTYRVVDADGSTVEQTFTVTIQPAGARYIAVSLDNNFSATELTAGNSYAANARELVLPTWTGNQYIAIAQPQDDPDLTSLSLGGLGNALSSFTKASYTRTIGGIAYEVWVSNDPQGSLISGETIEVRP